MMAAVAPSVREFLAAGVALIPIPLGEKGPRIKGWQRREAAVFGEQNAQQVAGMNVGLVHEWSGTCAVDIDDHDAADEWLTPHGINLEALFCRDNAVSVSSGRSNHGKLLFRLPDGASPIATFKVKDDDERVILEFRCAGSQDVVAGRHPSGTDYSVSGDPASMPTLPDALWMLWQEQLGQPRAARPGATVNGGEFSHHEKRVGEGGRNETLTREAGRLRHLGLSVGELDAALQTMNTERCAPPLPAHEVAAIAASVGRYPPAVGARKPGADEPVYPTALDLVALAKMPVPVALHRVGQIMPLGTPGLLTGHGGVGKTQLAVELALCLPKGLRFFGEPTLTSRVGFASGEDDARECHRRLAMQASILGVDIADYADQLFVYDISGEDAILLHQTRDDHVVQTHHYAWLKAEVEQRRIEVLIIDNLLTVFAGNINDPAIATRVIGMLGRLVQPGGNVIILAHVDKNTAREGRSAQGYSGTAAWHNRVRWRWFMYAPNAGDDAADDDPTAGMDDGRRILEVQKNNAGPTGQRYALRLIEGAVTAQAGGGIVASIERGIERKAVLAAMREAAPLGVNIPTAETNRSTAYEALEAMPSYPSTLRGKSGKRRLFGVLRQLRADREISVAPFKSSGRHSRDGYVLARIES